MTKLELHFSKIVFGDVHHRFPVVKPILSQRLQISSESQSPKNVAQIEH
jgi:hypothetical protein